MRERAREGVEVLHHLLLAEALDLDGAVADAGGFQRGDDVGERVALAHEDGAAAFGLAKDLDDSLGFGFAVRRVVPGDRLARERRVVRRGGGVRHRAERLVGLGGEDAREGVVEEFDQLALRAEVGGESQRLESYVAQAFAPRVQEERDLGLAKAVDRLHRVADDEERAAIVSLPS